MRQFVSVNIAGILLRRANEGISPPKRVAALKEWLD